MALEVGKAAVWPMSLRKAMELVNVEREAKRTPRLSFRILIVAHLHEGWMIINPTGKKLPEKANPILFRVSFHIVCNFPYGLVVEGAHEKNKNILSCFEFADCRWFCGVYHE